MLYDDFYRHQLSDYVLFYTNTVDETSGRYEGMTK